MRKHPLLITSLSLLAFSCLYFSSIASASNGIITLYPKHKGPEKRNAYGFSCKVGVDKSRTINFTKKKKKHRCKNDSAKFIIFHGFVKAGTVIRLYDNSKGKKNDDWLDVKIKRDLINHRYVIPNLEYSFEDAFVKAKYHRKNGLNGKVSRMVIIAPK